jgi:hypothetical protein
LDAVWDAIIAHFEARSAYFQLFHRFRIRPDEWLKAEVLHCLVELEQAGQARSLRPNRQGCDVSFATSEGETWLAVKALLTSYAGAGRDARPTVLSVEEIARELDKLRGLATLGGGAPALLLAALAFGPEPRELNEWRTQMLRFEAKGFEPARHSKIPLGGERECFLYLLA